MLNRRHVIWQSIAMGFCAPHAWGLGAQSRFDVGELILPTGTVSRPRAWNHALYELVQSTSIETDGKSFQFSPEDPELYEHPFCVMIGTDGFEPLSKKALGMLQRFLTYGGFILFDDTSGDRDSAFSKSVRRLMRRMFPTKPIAPLAADHSLYRSFFLLDQPLGRLASVEFIEGVDVGKVTPMMLFHNDLSGALDRTEDGRDRYAVIPDGDMQRREAVKLVINMIMYALTSNYKHDQAHVKELIEDGRLDEMDF
jgi:hypothetical protein